MAVVVVVVIVFVVVVVGVRRGVVGGGCERVECICRVAGPVNG